MKKMVRIILIVIMMMFMSVVSQQIFAADFPQIENFSIRDLGNGLRICFDFKKVFGGLKGAEFTIGYVVENKEGVVLRYGIAENLAIVSKLTTAKITDLDLESNDGKFEAVVPAALAKIAKKGLKSGDKIKYFIFLIDKEGRKSNTIFYEFLFVECWEI